MTCEQVRDELIAYMKGELTEERRVEIDEHLARCVGCQREREIVGELLKVTESAHEMSVIRMVSDIIKEAIEVGASDIHVVPTCDGADVLLRVDGLLRAIRQITAKERDALVGRIRLMGGMSLTETKIPQDGHTRAKLDEQIFDLRITVMPFLLGEKVAIRILARTADLPGLDKPTFLPEQMASVDLLMRQPCGVLYFSGPAGAGRTTVLYSLLRQIVDPARSIITIEDPIEVQFDGIQQSQVDRKAGLTFAAALRSFLRQDPDVIVVSETGDAETLGLVTRAAMTGHLVLTSVHAQHAVQVPQRLVNMGIDPYLFGESVAGIISSMLGRIICSECKEEYTPTPEALRWLGLADVVGNTRFYHGAGCDHCRGGGYHGRFAMHEVLVMDSDLARMFSSGQTDPNAILRHVTERGFIPMIEVARKRVLEGLTTAEEMFRISHGITSGPV